MLKSLASIDAKLDALLNAFDEEGEDEEQGADPNATLDTMPRVPRAPIATL